MAEIDCKFDELEFFAQVKKRPGLFLGTTSFLSLRDQLFGMGYAFSFYDNQEDPLKYFSMFVKWYCKEAFEDLSSLNGYECWWNHMLYVSGNNDAYAFDLFFKLFERYLRDAHNLYLPDVK